MTWLTSRIGRAVAAILAVLAFLIGARATWRREGAQGAEKEAREADTARANEIEERADEARSTDSGLTPDDRLRKHNKLRD